MIDEVNTIGIIIPHHLMTGIDGAKTKCEKSGASHSCKNKLTERSRHRYYHYFHTTFSICLPHNREVKFPMD